MDPKTDEKLSAVAWYVTALMDSSGLDGSTSAASPGAPPSEPSASPQPGKNAPATRVPDRWDAAPLLRVGSAELGEILGLPQGEKSIAPQALSRAKIKSPDFAGPVRFLDWAGLLVRRAQEKKKQPLSPLEDASLQLRYAYWTYEEHRHGLDTRIAPVQDSEKQQWWSLSELVHTSWTDAGDPTGLLRRARAEFLAARAALRGGSVERFREASAAFVAALGEAGPQLGEYPSDQLIALEVGYNRWAPFRFAWMFLTVAAVMLLVEAGVKRQAFYALAWASALAGLAAMLAGFGLRTAISGRAPVTNMYETVVYVGMGTALLGMIFEALSRRRYLMGVSAVIGALALILADTAPAVLDPHIRPLQPVLRDDYWLITHVMTITLSYAAFALAMGISDITLWFYLIGSKDRAAIDSQSRFTYRVLQIGVLFLAIGTILGAVWADQSWGRFWGWDPKEVWALISLVIYLTVLHARYIGWVNQLGLAAASAAGFLCVIVAWYGSNYWFAGLHSYGSGAAGGTWYVVGGMLLQAAYIAIAVVFARDRGVKVLATQEG